MASHLEKHLSEIDLVHFCISYSREIQSLYNYSQNKAGNTIAIHIKYHSSMNLVLMIKFSGACPQMPPYMNWKMIYNLGWLIEKIILRALQQYIKWIPSN